MTLAEKRVERIANGRAEPTWEIARLFPYQGEWSEEEYLALETHHLIEFDEGDLEVLPMPDIGHQRIVGFLVRHHRQ